MAQGAHGPATPQITRDPRLRDGWRAAATAHRRVYGEPRVDPHRGCAKAFKATTAALHAVAPELSEREAIAAVSYASQSHPKWLYALYPPKPSKR